MNALAAMAQYGSVRNDVTAASPHQLIMMMFNASVEALSQVIGAIDRKEFDVKSKQLTRAIGVINGLRDCLDMEKGGEIADNLYSLYSYMSKELFTAGFKNDVETIQNIQTMLVDIRGSWEKIPVDLHYVSALN